MFIRKNSILYPVGWKNLLIGRLAVGQLDNWQLAVGQFRQSGDQTNRRTVDIRGVGIKIKISFKLIL